MEEAELKYEKRDSVTVKRNAKGEYAWDIKLYWSSEDDEARIVVMELQHVDKMLRGTFLSG